MKLIIDIDDDVYDDIEHNKGDYINTLNWAVRNGIPYEERPQGEWTKDGKCPFCKKGVAINFYNNFCDYCGADMRGKEE